jgi:choline dehydrogenase|tara:strand:+ start:1008 stop:2654 length:1647 start_codon:yes stop_codon:yes gene_type:complete
MRNTVKNYDYVIVGAGSAGCVLANKLGEDKKYKILVLEAGPMDYNLMIHIPAGVYKAYRDPKINWNYLTENEPELFDRNVPMPRGKVVGGSSSINSMVYMRGHPLDYDRWQSECGLKDWSYDQCLPYFKQGENSDRGENQWRGGDGNLGVTKGSFDNPLFDAFEEAGRQSGQGYSEDLNGFNPEGIARLDATRKHGRRCSAAVAHLRPALARGNITLLTKAQVVKINISGNSATGVTFKHKGKLHSVEANKEVILSGGAINSPHLLMLSGIGPSQHLKEHGIEVHADLPGVGQNLQDHSSIILQYGCKKSFPIHKVNQPHRKLATGIRWVFTRKGLATSNIWEAGGLIKSSPNAAYPDIQYHFGPVGFEFNNDKISLLQAFAIHVDQLRPRSRGQVTLKSGNPLEKPLMTFNYLQDPKDLAEMVGGFKKARELISQPAFDEFRGVELIPGPHVKSDADIVQFIRGAAETDYHPSCTCAMGNGEMAVVDERMKVRGIKNLRVVDASVMPQIVSGNLNAPTQMIASRAADMILGKAQLRPIKTTFAFENE